MTTLRIANDLTLPVDAVTQAMAILARRGAGKTYTGSVIVEEAIGAGVPVVVLDPTGAWWGLRSSVDGEKPGLPVVIFGGDHGDVPLEPTAGAVLADLVLEHPAAYVLDLSGLLSKAAEQRFAADFLERLYRAKKRETGPLLVVVDEADVFAPQRPGPEQTRTLGALESIVRRGRIKGLGCLLITQRAAVLNKNVLTQTEVLIVMQTTGPQDRTAIDAWIEGNGTAEERAQVMSSLASLERGEAWVWSPSFLRILQRVRIRARKTFDSSRTPEPGETAIAPVAFARVDLDKLGARIAATIEKQKADDPKELRRRIAELERQAAAKPMSDGAPLEVARLRQELDEAREEIDLLTATKELLTEGIGYVADRVSGHVDDLRALLTPNVRKGGPSHEPRQPARVAQPIQKAQPASSERPIVRREPVATASSGEVSLKPAERAVLNALAQYPAGRSKVQAALLSGYSSTSGGFFGALAALRRYGYIEGTSEQLRITDVGRDALGSWDPLPTGRDLLDYWKAKLKPAEAGVLHVLVSAWPDTMAKTDVAAQAGYSATSGGFFGALAKLRKLDLIEGDGTALRATDAIAEHR
ncbi:MAG: hypothetical protein QOJ81_1329 [Chloroflexota bacterium]|jgi:hypothetical protein|nr:hypothetical protein [Chloroflexota bacterium]